MERFRRVQSKVALLVLLATSSAQAQEHAKLFQLRPLPTRLIPEYIACVYKDVRYACFDAAQTVELNVLEIQARYWHSQWEDYTSLLAVKEAELLKSQDQISLHYSMERQDQDQILVLNNRLTEEIEAKNMWRAKAESPPTWPLWVGGTFGLLGLGAFLGSIIR
jgi:hypothetical protein